MSQDALVYHLAVPQKFIELGRIHYVEGNFYSAFPMNVEMLFTWGLLLGGEQLAKWFHWLLYVGSFLAVGAIAYELELRRMLGRERIDRSAIDHRSADLEAAGRRALLAAVLFATIPSVMLIAGWAYVDLGVVFYCALSVLAFLRWAELATGDVVVNTADSEARSRGAAPTGYLVGSALFAGFAAGCKYTAMIQAIFIGLAIVYVGARSSWSLVRIGGNGAIVAGVVTLVAGPWFAKNWLLTGNPLFPFAHEVFRGADWDQGRADVLAHSLKEWGGLRELSDLVTLPWDVSVSSWFFSQERFDGVIGGAFLACLPLIVWGLWSSAGARRESGYSSSFSYRLVAAFALAHLATWVFTTHQIRFLLPALALTASLASVSQARFPSARVRAVTSGVLLASAMVGFGFYGVQFSLRNPLPVVFGLEDEDVFRDRNLPGGDYAVFQYIEEELPESSRILFGSCGNPGYLCRRPYYSDALFENRTLDALLAESRSPDRLVEAFERRGFTHLLFRLETVFDPTLRKSEIPLPRQRLLQEFLNRHGALLIRVDQTVLYEVGRGAGAAATESVDP